MCICFAANCVAFQQFNLKNVYSFCSNMPSLGQSNNFCKAQIFSSNSAGQSKFKLHRTERIVRSELHLSLQGSDDHQDNLEYAVQKIKRALREAILELGAGQDILAESFAMLTVCNPPKL